MLGRIFHFVKVPASIKRYHCENFMSCTWDSSPKQFQGSHFQRLDFVQSLPGSWKRRIRRKRSALWNPPASSRSSKAFDKGKNFPANIFFILWGRKFQPSKAQKAITKERLIVLWDYHLTFSLCRRNPFLSGNFNFFMRNERKFYRNTILPSILETLACTYLEAVLEDWYINKRKTFLRLLLYNIHSYRMKNDRSNAIST